MTQSHRSFEQSPHGVFIQSPHGNARNGITGTLIFAGSNIITPLITFGNSVVLEDGVYKVLGQDSLAGTVLDMEAFQGELYAGGFGLSDGGFGGLTNQKTGKFDIASGEWIDIDGGANLVIVGSEVSGMAIFQGELAMVGDFDRIQDFPPDFTLPAATGGVAWDGANYQSLGLDDATSPWFAAGVTPTKCIVYEGFLIANGFNIVRKYAGGGVGTWSKLFAGDGDTGGETHRAIALFGADVAFGGSSFVRSWNVNDTAYTELGTVTGGTTRVLALVEFEGDLIAAGNFTDIDGTTVSNIARFNGTDWVTIGSGFNGTVDALAIDADGVLLAGGDFSQNGNGDDMHGLAVFSGSEWIAADTTATNGNITALINFEGDIE